MLFWPCRHLCSKVLSHRCSDVLLVDGSDSSYRGGETRNLYGTPYFWYFLTDMIWSESHALQQLIWYHKTDVGLAVEPLPQIRIQVLRKKTRPCGPAALRLYWTISLAFPFDDPRWLRQPATNICWPKQVGRSQNPNARDSHLIAETAQWLVMSGWFPQPYTTIPKQGPGIRMQHT